MTERYDLCQGKKKKNGETYWHKIGAAWPRDGNRFKIIFDSLPTPVMDEKYGLQLDAMLFPADESRDQTTAASPPAVEKQPIDDDIPF
mgnify:CR=1 FL=1|jgi:hypothetical protein